MSERWYFVSNLSKYHSDSCKSCGRRHPPSVLSSQESDYERHADQFRDSETYIDVLNVFYFATEYKWFGGEFQKNIQELYDIAKDFSTIQKKKEFRKCIKRLEKISIPENSSKQTKRVYKYAVDAVWKIAGQVAIEFIKK